MIGFGCDGTNVNIGEGGLRGILEQSVPWVAVFWCLAHRLELALKDALKGTLFPTIDEMLLLLYYLYHKSPKKCNELNEVAASLKLCQQLVDIDQFVPVEHNLCTIKFQQLVRLLIGMVLT